MPATTCPTLEALELVTVNDWALTCSRLRVVLRAAGHASPGADRENIAGNALREWWRTELAPAVLQAAESSLRGEHHAESARARGKGERVVSWNDSLPNGACLAVLQLVSDAIDTVPTAAWIAVAREVLDEHDGAMAAAVMFPHLERDGDDPSCGEWTVDGLAAAAEIPRADAEEGLSLLTYHHLVGDRYVGGTSGTLFALLPAQVTMPTYP